jgi:two-component system phosphate regulon response regulator PhoB
MTRTDLVIIHSRDPDLYMLLGHILVAAGFRSMLADDLDAVDRSQVSDTLAVIVDSSERIERVTDFCSALKADPKTAHLPLLGLLRARHEQNYIRLLKAGIDEVFVRPVSPERILAYLRSLAGSGPPVAISPAFPKPRLRFGDLDFDDETRCVTGKEGTAQLSPIEFRMLKMLVEAPGRVFSRSDLIRVAWPPNHTAQARTVDVHIGNLRRILTQKTGRNIIRTIRSNGYFAEIVDDTL